MQVELTFWTCEPTTDFLVVHKVTTQCAAENVNQLLYGTVSKFQWTDPENWTLTLDNVRVQMPIWLQKFDTIRYIDGDEENGVSNVFYVIKPFLPFTPAEVSKFECYEEKDSTVYAVTQNYSMDTGGVLLDNRFPPNKLSYVYM
jgi:hypothetical protein